MISDCRSHLETKLKGIGINRVFLKSEDAAKHQAYPYAVVTFGDEGLRFDGSLVARADDPDTGERTFRRRLYFRTVPAQVKIVHRDQVKAEELGTEFLTALDRRILDADGNAILISARNGEPEEDTSLLKQQGLVVYEVVFEGGVYKDKTVKLFDLETTLVVEGEITEEV